MTPRFQADADFNHRIVLGVRRREPAIDFRDALAGGVIGAADSTVLRIAAESGRILVSHDRKTIPVHLARFLESHSSPGVILVSQSLDIGAGQCISLNPTHLPSTFSHVTFKDLSFGIEAGSSGWVVRSVSPPVANQVAPPS
jgi:hypothetical protein